MTEDCHGDHLWRGGGSCVLCGARLRCYCGAFVREDGIEEHLEKKCRVIVAAKETENFWRRVQICDDGCWLWTGYLTPKGYGHTRHRGRMTFAHRITYEAANGPVPSGLEIDHLCRVRNCVNPAHLEAVTHRENMLRSTTLQYECKRGHRFDEANTYLYRGRRCCRECDRIRGAAYRERRRNARV